MSIDSKSSVRVPLSVWVLFGQACLVMPAAAQFDYMSQSRSVGAVARSYATTVLPPANPSSGSPTYVTDGVTDTDQASSAAQDFGVFDRSVSASASFAASTSTVDAAQRSELGVDGIRLDMSYAMQRQGYNAVIESYADSANIQSVASFSLDDVTAVAIWSDVSFGGGAIPRTWSVQLTNSATGQVSDLSFNSAPTITLMPGAYTLSASLTAFNPLMSNVSGTSGFASFSMVAVPEVSTWGMMGLGLLGVVAWTGRRRRAQ